MKILLITPAVDHLRMTAELRDVPRRAMLRFSVLPLTVVAALTPRKHTVQICDENIEPVDLDADVDLVGITFMTALAPRAYELAYEFRRRGRLVVAGGYHPTFMPEEAAGHFNAVVVGDAEGLWPRVVRDAETGRLQNIYRHESLPDLSAVPIPRRDLTKKNADYYVTTDAVQVGRGCRHGCRYCSVTAFHQKTYRARPLENVLAELQQIDRHFIFVDDNIIADPDYARRLFKAMIPLKKLWVSQSSVEIADDPGLLRLAYEAGCRGLFVGIETIREDNLNAVSKGFNQQRDVRKRIHAIQRRGIHLIAGMIVGMDGDDVLIFERTLRFLEELGIAALQLNIMTPLPGTPLFQDFERAGRITDHDWKHYDFRHVVIRPNRMAAAELQNGADWLYQQFYRQDRMFRRCLRVLFNAGLWSAIMAFRLNLTYRYDIRREKIRGSNPAKRLVGETADVAWADVFTRMIRRATIRHETI